MTPEVRQVLIDMKAALSAGWTQKRLVDLDGRVCVFGAAAKVGRGRGIVEGHAGTGVAGRWQPGVTYDVNLTFDLASPVGQALTLLAQEAGVDVLQLARWQDKPERTQAEVVDLIDRVLQKGTAPRILEADLLEVGEEEPGFSFFRRRSAPLRGG